MRSALLLVAALNGLAFNAFAQNASTATLEDTSGSTPSALADLPPAVRNDISRACLPVQYQNGAAAYRECVQNQIDSRTQPSQGNSVNALLTNLSFDDRYAIQQVCGTDDDAQAQRCRATQVSALQELPEPKLGDLTSDEQYVMQQTCFTAQSSQGAAAYRTCQLNEIASIDNSPVPEYSSLSAVDRNALQLRCSATQTKLAGYRNCLIDGAGSAPSQPSSTSSTDAAAATLRNTPDADESLTNSNAIRIQPEVGTVAEVLTTTNEIPEVTNTEITDVTNTASTRPRLITPPEDELPIIDSVPELGASLSADELASSTVNSSTSTNTVTDTKLNTNPVADATAVIKTTDTAPAAELPTVIDADQPDAQSDTGNSEAADGESEPTDLVKLWLERIKNFTLDAFGGLSQQGKMLLAALIVMPIALWMLLMGRRRRPEEDYVDAAYSPRENLKSRVRAQLDPEDFEEDDYDPISANWASEADSLFDDAPTLEPAGMVKPKRVPDMKRELEPELELEEDLMKGFEEDEIAPTVRLPKAKSKNAQRNGFAGWLHNQSPKNQLSLSVEFLVYWMAFGDERYDPALKRRIFQAADPSVHDVVKRWVLKEDVHAFADAVAWIQENTTEIQKEQIVRLLMALLINGNIPTPVQNTLLRFLGDVFYLEKPNLETIYEQDFQTDLPAVPRVDRLAWWEQQSTDAVSLWDVQTINAGDELTRHAAQFGLDPDAGPELVEAAYEEALERCDPTRFDQLGDREYQLIEARRSRLLQARDELMEAMA